MGWTRLTCHPVTRTTQLGVFQDGFICGLERSISAKMRTFRWVSLTAAIALLSLMGVFFFWFKTVPDVRGVQVFGRAQKELLSAGFCVEWHTNLSRNWNGPIVSDGNTVVGEYPEPGHWWSRQPPGTTIRLQVTDPIGPSRMTWPSPAGCSRS